MTPQEELNTLPKRIKSIYNTCNEEEQGYLVKILEELSETGYSETYDTLWLCDYKEIPVDIDTFIESDTYLGRATDGGRSVYPFWKKCMNDVFEDPSQYQEVVLSGATRLGKTSSACTCVAYMLYRLMCLRNPQQFYNKKSISKFSILFFNVNLDLARGVAFRELNQTLRSSPWFNEHGTFTRSEQNYVYVPEGNQIEINAGSSSQHALGQQVYCIVGDTVIQTDRGLKRIDELEGQEFKVIQYNIKNNTYHFSDTTTCIKTKQVHDTIRITLENGSVIEGTHDHKVLLSDGTYKQLQDLTEDDDLMYTFN